MPSGKSENHRAKVGNLKGGDLDEDRVSSRKVEEDRK